MAISEVASERTIVKKRGILGVNGGGGGSGGKI